MKTELPVIANQHGAVKLLKNSVHTACHVLGVGMFNMSYKDCRIFSTVGEAWELVSDRNEVITR